MYENKNKLQKINDKQFVSKKIRLFSHRGVYNKKIIQYFVSNNKIKQFNQSSITNAKHTEIPWIVHSYFFAYQLII